MRTLRSAVFLIVLLGLVACGAEKDVAMPDVNGKRLDAAYDAIKDAGFEDKDKVQIEGGGTFGVVMEGNWTVCEQSPPPGAKVTSAPKLRVERSCDDNNAEEEEDRGVVDSESSGGDQTATPTPSPELPEILTTTNSPEFAALLKLGDNCSAKISKFAKEHLGEEVRFNGAIQALAPHGDADTRFDFLIGAGNYDPNRAIGPSFQFRDKNAVYDLHLTGKNVPDYIRAGQNFTFTAQLGEYDRNTCLYQLIPVETKVR